jgi:hypothetical protein
LIYIQKSFPIFDLQGQSQVEAQLTTDHCTGEAFGELFLAMTDNLSSKGFN